jgi:hypothetical protein
MWAYLHMRELPLDERNLRPPPVRDALDDGIKQRQEPCEQCAIRAVADPHPHHTGSGSAEHHSRRKVLVFTDDDGTLSLRFLPDRFVFAFVEVVRAHV